MTCWVTSWMSDGLRLCSAAFWHSLWSRLALEVSRHRDPRTVSEDGLWREEGRRFDKARTWKRSKSLYVLGRHWISMRLQQGKYWDGKTRSNTSYVTSRCHLSGQIILSCFHTSSQAMRTKCQIWFDQTLSTLYSVGSLLQSPSDVRI